jgi:hypothetical protein
MRAELVGGGRLVPPTGCWSYRLMLPTTLTRDSRETHGRYMGQTTSVSVVVRARQPTPSVGPNAGRSRRNRGSGRSRPCDPVLPRCDEAVPNTTISGVAGPLSPTSCGVARMRRPIHSADRCERVKGSNKGSDGTDPRLVRLDLSTNPALGRVLVPHTGFEPVISALRGRCPGPLDECGLGTTTTAADRSGMIPIRVHRCHQSRLYSRCASRKPRIASATCWWLSSPTTRP